MVFRAEAARGRDLADGEIRFGELARNGLQTHPVDHAEHALALLLSEALVEEAPRGAEAHRHVRRRDALGGVAPDECLRPVGQRRPRRDGPRALALHDRAWRHRRVEGRLVAVGEKTPQRIRLGGPLEEFRADALELADYSVLEARNDIDLNVAGRGVTITGNAGMAAPENATLAISNDITWKGALAKIGAGTLALGGKAIIPSGETASLAVGEGFLEVRSTNAVDGVAVTFASGAHLLVDPTATGDVATYGAVNLSATPFGGTLPVAFDLPAIGENGEHRYADIAVATVRDAATAAALNLSARKIPGHGVTFSTRSNTDGTVSILASIGRNGIVLVVR